MTKDLALRWRIKVRTGWFSAGSTVKLSHILSHILTLSVESEFRLIFEELMVCLDYFI